MRDWSDNQTRPDNVLKTRPLANRAAVNYSPASSVCQTSRPLGNGDTADLPAARPPQGVRAGRRAAAGPDRGSASRPRRPAAAGAGADRDLPGRPVLDPRGPADARVPG